MEDVTARLANRLTQAIRQRFVGRRAELELFRIALSQDVPDFAILHLHGPGGMGKTTLLRQFALIAEEMERPFMGDFRDTCSAP
jgi:ABC-type transport system involved in cytochrome c biogenesis ATPase subunit